MSESKSKNLSAKGLVAVLLSGINPSSIKLLKESNPIRYDFEGTIYNVYLKNVTYAGNPYPENHTRAQLPKHDDFNRIKSSDERFLFLGYDSSNDVFVCWDPSKAKARLNAKNYVSFVSRKSIQESVEEGDIKSATLTNGDKFVLFKRTDFEAFLTLIDKYFPSLSSTAPQDDHPNNPTPVQVAPLPKGEDVVGILSDIEHDISIKLVVDTMKQNNSTITIIAHCMSEYGHNYPNMQFKDWGKIIRKYLELNP